MERGGLRGLYTGYAATMIRDLPYFALQLGFYGKFYFDVLSGYCYGFFADGDRGKSLYRAKSSQSPELLISGAIAIIPTLNTVFLNFQTILRTA